MVWKLELNGGKLTKRDQKLLVFVSVVIILTISFFYFIRPMSKSIKANKAEIPVQEEVKIVYDQKIALLDSQRLLLDTNTQKYEEAKQNYFPVMESDEIDKFMTGMALDFDLEAINLNISINPEEAQIWKYLGTPTENAVFVTAKVNMQCRGDKEDLQAMLDHLLNEERSLRVAGFNWVNVAQLSPAGLTSRETLKMDIEIYMIR